MLCIQRGAKSDGKSHSQEEECKASVGTIGLILISEIVLISKELEVVKWVS